MNGGLVTKYGSVAFALCAAILWFASGFVNLPKVLPTVQAGYPTAIGVTVLNDLARSFKIMSLLNGAAASCAAIAALLQLRPITLWLDAYFSRFFLKRRLGEG